MLFDFVLASSKFIITPPRPRREKFKGKRPNFVLQAGKTLETNIFPKVEKSEAN